MTITFKTMMSDPLAKRRFKALLEISKTAKKLGALLCQDEAVAEVLTTQVGEPSLSEIRHAIEYLTRITESAIEDRIMRGRTDRAPIKLHHAKNPTHYLVGRLGRIADTHLAIKSTISRPAAGGPAGGPFVRFCEAASREMFPGLDGDKPEFQLTGETVAKALYSNPLINPELRGNPAT